MANVLHLGDQMMCQLPWGSTPFPVVVRGFSLHGVRVEAEERSHDVGVENVWNVDFSWLSRP